VRIGTAASFDAGGAGATERAVFRNLLVLPDGEINDPAVFTTPVPNYYGGEVFMLGDGGQLRIVHLDLKLDEAAVEHLYQQGIGADVRRCEGASRRFRDGRIGPPRPCHQEVIMLASSAAKACKSRNQRISRRIEVAPNRAYFKPLRSLQNGSGTNASGLAGGRLGATSTDY
jgi:hypothetical protein